MKNIYLLFAVAGTIIPYAFFGNFAFEHGLNLSEFIAQLFATSPASGFTADLLVTSAAFWIWSFREAKLRGLNNWWGYVVLNLFVGLSCALPLFLYFRQSKIDLAQGLETSTRGTGQPVLSG